MPQILAVSPAPTAPARTPAEMLNDAVARAVREDYTGAASALQEIEPFTRHRLVVDAVERVTQSDPQKAGRLTLALPVGPSQVAAADATARAWADRDLPGAARWAASVPDISARVAAIRALAARTFERSPNDAMNRLQAVSSGERRMEFLTLAASEWARRDPDAAIAWARGVSDAELRTRALTSIAFEIAQTNPERAIPVAELLPPGRDRWIVLGAIGRSWAVRNSSAALAWAHQQPAGEARDAAVAGVEAGLGAIAWNAPAASGAPLAALMPSNIAGPRQFNVERDEDLRREFENRLRTSPSLTGDWLMSLPAAQRREEFMHELAREWLATNPAAARQWIDQNVMSEPERRQLLHEGGVGVHR
jgi:hypothetical protein